MNSVPLPFSGIRLRSIVVLTIALLFTIPPAYSANLELIAGGGTSVEGKIATDCKISQPFGVAFDPQDNMFICEETHRILRVDAKTGILTVLCSAKDKDAPLGDGGPVGQASFTAPHDLVADAEGNLFIADTGHRLVRRVDAKTGIVTTFAGTGKAELNGDGGPAAKASLDGVVCLYFNHDFSKLYLGGFSKAVRAIDMKTGVIDTVRGIAGSRAHAVDSKGNIFTATARGVRMHSPDGKTQVLEDSTATPALNAVKHLWVDEEDNILIADSGNHLIRKFVTTEKRLITLAGTGTKGTAGINGPALQAQFGEPHGIMTHPRTGDIYIADSRNHRVLRIKNPLIKPTDSNLIAGLSPYNWVIQNHTLSTTIVGASLSVGFTGTKSVALRVDTKSTALKVASRFPIIAWSINGGAIKTHQLSPGESSVTLATDAQDPIIDLYVKGMSPFEDRWSGEVPPNSLKITGFQVDEGGKTKSVQLPEKVWLNIGDSILSGDGAAYQERQGRPKDELWAESDDGRASYGYLLAKHYGYRESRLAYGGYNWSGGMARIPALMNLIDHRTEKVSRLTGETLSPPPAIVLINLGTNGRPREEAVSEALQKVRKRAGTDAKILVMVPVSGAARTEVTAAFEKYKTASGDKKAYLIDLGKVKFATTDGVHPTTPGHQVIFEAARPVLDPILK